MGYRTGKIANHPQIILCCIPQWRKIFTIVSHNRENFHHCIPQCKTCCCIVSYNVKKQKYLITARKLIFQKKAVLPKNQGPRWSSLMKKKIRGKKSHDTISLHQKLCNSTNFLIVRDGAGIKYKLMCVMVYF